MFSDDWFIFMAGLALGAMAFAPTPVNAGFGVVAAFCVVALWWLPRKPKPSEPPKGSEP